MHEAVRAYVRENRPPAYRFALEVGSLDINGGIRDLLDPSAGYLGIDRQNGPGVDLVRDFADYTHTHPVDLVICCEVLEHTPQWRELIAAAARNLGPGGVFLVTCATQGRHPHSGIHGGAIQPGEFYENVSPEDLDAELAKHFAQFGSEVVGTDLRARAVR